MDRKKLVAIFLCLFATCVLVGCAHRHDYSSTVVDPTCTEKGYTEYVCDCGDTYKDNYVDELEHEYASSVISPTCTEKGYTEYVCDCGDTYKSNYVNALGHDYTDYVYNGDGVYGLNGTMTRSCKREGCLETQTTANELLWITYYPDAFYNKTIATNKTSVRLGGAYAATPINKYKIEYSLDEPVKGYITIGTHTEDFFLEAGENLTFTSFTDFVLGDRSTYLTGEKVINGKTYSGAIKIEIEPIQDVTATFTLKTFSIVKQDVEDKVLYVQNQRFKVGTHLYYGGSLTYFEDLQDGDPDIGNLVNIHDGGRLLQQSYYGKDSKANGGMSYNPVQGGNGYGYSKIIDFDVDGNTIYTKSRAKNWTDSSSYDLTPSYMENWYTVDDDNVVVKNTFVDFLNPSDFDYTGELPAVYWVGALRTLCFYAGADSWTRAEVSKCKLINDGPAVGRHWQGSTETWTACLNDEGWGAGVYTPGMSYIVSGYYGHGGATETSGITYDPLANSTVYVGMDGTFSLQPFEKLTYSYMVTSGNLEQIRDVFYDNIDFAENKFNPTFEDAYDIENLDYSEPEALGFNTRLNNAVVVYDEEREATKVAVSGSCFDPYFGISFLSRSEKPQAEDYPYISVEYMIPNEMAGKFTYGGASLYLGLGTAEWVNGSHVLGFNLIADGKWHVAYIPFGEQSWYTGNINIMRFDFIGSGSFGQYYYIRSIKLCKERPVTDEVYDDDYVPQTKNWLAHGTSSTANYAYAVDAQDKRTSSLAMTGWLLCYDKIHHFEFLVYEKDTKSTDYKYSAEAEALWMYAQRTGTRLRADAANAYPNIGDTGESAGFNLYVDLSKYMDGKTYVVAIRAITNGGDACYIRSYEHTFTYGKNYLERVSTSTEGFDVSIDRGGFTEENKYWCGGWLICHDGIDHFEYLIYESKYYDNKYPYSIEAESLWKTATRTATINRADAANACPGIESDGVGAGFDIEIDLSSLTAGKTYSIYFRAITKGGDACMFHNVTYTA